MTGEKKQLITLLEAKKTTKFQAKWSIKMKIIKYMNQLKNKFSMILTIKNILNFKNKKWII